MFKTIFLIAAISIAANIANAQFGIDKVTEKAKKATTKTENPPQTDQKDTSVSNKMSAGAGTILQNSLLDYFKFNSKTGFFQIEQARVMNLPASAEKDLVFAKIKTADGSTLGTYSSPALPPKRNKSWLLSGFSAEGNSSLDLKLTTPGEYVLEFSTGGKVFERFPFSIEKAQTPKGETQYLINGMWNDLAYFNTTKELYFHIWMRDRLEGTGNRDAEFGKYSIKIIRENDNIVVGENNTDRSGSLIYPTQNWVRQDIPLIESGAKNFPGLTIETLAAKGDGNYRVELYLPNGLYGKYPFTISGGKIQGVNEYKSVTLGTNEGEIIWIKRTNGK